MSAAGPSQIFVSRTVVELTAGAQIDFNDLGTRELKGVPGSTHVFEVDRA
jgi:class 3 adenylate cyclase